MSCFQKTKVPNFRNINLKKLTIFECLESALKLKVFYEINKKLKFKLNFTSKIMFHLPFSLFCIKRVKDVMHQIKKYFKFGCKYN